MPRVIAPAARRRRQHGAGALIVVLVLFFIMALVAAYSSRNMIFEQKTSANQYRATQAFEAADAGVEWALAMLNGGRITDACQATNSNPALTSFRQRYLDIAPGGAIARRMYFDSGGTQKPLNVRCVRDGGAWSCSCPTSSAPTLAAPSTTDPAPAFQLVFEDVMGRPGVVRVRSQGCTSLIELCLTTGTASGSDATAAVDALIALKGGLSTPPVAALTARRDIAVTGALQVVNADPLNGGITAHAGRTIVLATPPQTVPGSPPEQSLVPSDAALDSRPLDVMFSAYFGMTAGLYADQPGTIKLTCPADCGAAALASKAQFNPGRMLWLEGDVTLDSSVDIGSPASPVVVVVNGALQSTASPRIYGLVYVNNADWATSGAMLVQGAVIARQAVSGTGSGAIVFDPDILNRLRTASGSFVRVPGGWKDF